MPTPDAEITNTFHTTYSANYDFALQDSMQRLAPLAERETGNGEKYLIRNIVGQDQMVERTTRNQDNVYGETDHDRVWVTKPNPGEYIRLQDSQDLMQTMIGINGAYVRGGVNAHNRWWDDKFIGAFYGDMLMGKEGTTVVPFDTNNVVGVTEGSSGAAGLNAKKIIAARTILRENFAEFDEDEAYLGITAKQAQNLLEEVKFTNADYASLGGGPRMSADGKKLIGLLGFSFVELELGNPLFYNAALTVDGSSYRKNPFWVKSGMKMVPWEEKFARVEQIPTKGYAWQVFARTVVTATRTDNGRCGYILNSEA